MGSLWGRASMSVLTQTAIKPRELPPKVRRRRFLMGVADHSIAIVLALMFMLPLFIVVTTAFMSHEQVRTGQLIPNPVDFGNYKRVVTEIPFMRYLGNTIVYAVLATIGVVVSSIPVAYAFSRMRWKGRD